MKTIDPRKLRDALGCFATGVTVITTADKNGSKYGVTANSYNSVSLDPPLILWSLAKSSRSMTAFAECEAFVVHILGAHQEALAMRFSSRRNDKFAGLETSEGLGGSPRLGDCAAILECRTESSVRGGDHMIFIGRVVNFESYDHAPLLFHWGRFAKLG